MHDADTNISSAGALDCRNRKSRRVVAKSADALFAEAGQSIPGEYKAAVQPLLASSDDAGLQTGVPQLYRPGAGAMLAGYQVNVVPEPASSGWHPGFAVRIQVSFASPAFCRKTELTISSFAEPGTIHGRRDGAEDREIECSQMAKSFA